MSFKLWQGSITNFIELPNPLFGNTRSYITGVINRETRGGEIKSYKDTNWPENEVLNFSWSILTSTQVEALKTFITTYAGQEIHIIDHNDDEWIGIILTDILDIVTNKDNCSYGTNIEFIGEKDVT